MPVKKLIELESDTVANKPVSVPFDFPNKESVPKGKKMGETIVISPLTVRTYFKLKPLLLKIAHKDFDKLIPKNGEDVAPSAEVAILMGKYADTLLSIICIGIHNKKSDPPEWFRQVLLDNSTWEDLYILLNAVLYRIGYTPFCNSITTVRSVSPMTEQEIIACQKNLKSWTNL